MNIYSIEFNGHYPVGAVAIVRAESEQDAALKLFDEFEATAYELLLKNNGIDKLDITKLDLENDECVILLDGNY